MRADLLDSWVGIADQDVPQTLRVFPNPVTAGTMQVEVLAPGMWCLFDAYGRQLRNGQWMAPGTQSLDVAGLASGTYILTTAEGQFARFMVD